MKFADRVKETTTATSASTITLAGAVTGFRSFAAGLTVGDTDIPVSVADSAGNWEDGFYTLTNAATLTRTEISASSNGGAAVTFPAGSKDVFCTAHEGVMRRLQDATTGSSSSVRDIAFSTAIPLTFAGESIMPVTAVSGPLALSIAAGAVRGALVWMSLKADGTNVPTITGSTEWGGSSGYLNTANVLNVLQVFYDGYKVRHSWGQDANPVAEPTNATAVTLTGSTSGVAGSPTTFTVGTNGTRASAVTVTPTPVSGVTFSPTSVTLAAGTSAATFTATSSTTGTKSIAVTNNGGLNNPSAISWTVAAAATAPGAPTIGTATAGDSSASVAFTAPSSDGGASIIDYTVTASPGGATATGTASPINVTGLTNGTAYTFTVKARNSVGSSSASSASNSVTPAAAVSAIRLSPRSSDLTESASPPWVYTGTGATYGGAIGGVATQGLQSGVDGSLSMTFTNYTGTSAGAEFMLGLQSGTTVASFTSLPYAFYTEFAQGKYTPFTSGTRQPSTNTVTPVDGDIMRLRRSGTTVIAEVARAAAPTTFTTIYTWTGVPTSALKFQGVVGSGPGTIGNLTGVGLA